MNKLITFFLVMLIGCGILVGAMAGGGGVVTTVLSQNMTSNSTVMYVSSTTDFLSEDYVIVEAEKILKEAELGIRTISGKGESVVKQDPLPGTKIPCDRPVDLALGPPPPCTVPDVIKMPLK